MLRNIRISLTQIKGFNMILSTPIDNYRITCWLARLTSSKMNSEFNFPSKVYKIFLLELNTKYSTPAIIALIISPGLGSKILNKCKYFLILNHSHVQINLQ